MQSRNVAKYQKAWILMILQEFMTSYKKIFYMYRGIAIILHRILFRILQAALQILCAITCNRISIIHLILHGGNLQVKHRIPIGFFMINLNRILCRMSARDSQCLSKNIIYVNLKRKTMWHIILKLLYHDQLDMV